MKPTGNRIRSSRNRTFPSSGKAQFAHVPSQSESRRGRATSETMMQVNGSGSACWLPDRSGAWECSNSTKLVACVALAGAALLTTPACAQINPSSAQNPFYGSVTVTPVTDEPLRLSLDNAIQMGLEEQPGAEGSPERGAWYSCRAVAGAAGVSAYHQPRRRLRLLPAQPGGAGIRAAWQ